MHDANGFVLDRIQSAGPGDLNIPEDKIYELGNFNSIATVRDIPEITFDMESYDVSTEFEALLINEDPSSFSSTPGSNDIDFVDAVPIDIISPWKSRRGQYDIVKGISIPYLTLESATYRFGVGDFATQSFSLRGDSIFYCPAVPRYEEFDVVADGPTTYTLDQTAIEYNYGGDTIHVLSVCLINTTTNAYQRLFFDSGGTTGYDDTATTFTLANDPTASYQKVRVTYATENATSYTQTGNNPTGNAVHNTSSVKPAAVKGKDIDVILYIGTSAVETPLNSVQSFEVTWSVTLENDEELGNERYVDTDYDIPEVNGSMAVKPFDADDLWTKLSQITGVPDDEVIGPNITDLVPTEIRVKDPDDGTVLKTFYIPDARFQVPGYQGQVQTKLEQTMNFSSDSGVLYVYNGARV